MTLPVYSMPPNLRRPKANCTAITMPIKTLVTVTIPREATPSASIWCMMARTSNGRRKKARSVPSVICVIWPTCATSPSVRSHCCCAKLRCCKGAIRKPVPVTEGLSGYVPSSQRLDTGLEGCSLMVELASSEGRPGHAGSWRTLRRIGRIPLSNWRRATVALSE